MRNDDAEVQEQEQPEQARAAGGAGLLHAWWGARGDSATTLGGKPRGGWALLAACRDTLL